MIATRTAIRQNQPKEEEGNAKLSQAAFHLIPLKRALSAHNANDLEGASAQKRQQAYAMTLPS
jgi:hypothetical protein